MILNNLKSKIESKRTMKHLCKALAKAYANTDYSNYEIRVTYDEELNMLIVPLPVMALSFVDEDLSDWIAERINEFSAEGILIA